MVVLSEQPDGRLLVMLRDGALQPPVLPLRRTSAAYSFKRMFSMTLNCIAGWTWYPSCLNSPPWSGICRATAS